MNDVTRVLASLERGERHAAEQLLPFVYDELRRLAAEKIAHEKAGQTLQATALVHEAYVRLVDAETAQQWNSRGHFFAAAAEAMRRILVENARRKGRLRRGGDRDRVDLQDVADRKEKDATTILAVNDAIEELAADDAAAANVVKLHFFGGLTLDETAAALGISRATAYRQWAYARAWLKSRLPDSRDGE